MRILSVDHRASHARKFLAVRAAIAAWAGTGVLLAALLAFPSDRFYFPPVLIAAAGFSFAWALTLWVMPADPRIQRLFALTGYISVLQIPLAVAASGGALSAARAWPLVTVVYAAWFFDARIAGRMAVLAGALNLLPLAYDPRAFDNGALPWSIGLTLVLGLTAGLMIVARGELARLRDKARAEALRDPLTGLANRRALIAFLERRVEDRRGDGQIGVVVLDLDSFKQVNTHHGHAGGDAALVAAAHALQGTVRTDIDLAARLGGDEFALVVRDTDRAELAEIGERAVAAVQAAAEQLELDGVDLATSAGSALLPEDAGSIDAVLARADLALAVAKRAGKGCYVSALELDVDAPIAGAA